MKSNFPDMPTLISGLFVRVFFLASYAYHHLDIRLKSLLIRCSIADSHSLGSPSNSSSVYV
jgi:hypothetical protein